MNWRSSDFRQVQAIADQTFMESCASILGQFYQSPIQSRLLAFVERLVFRNCSVEFKRVMLLDLVKIEFGCSLETPALNCVRLSKMSCFVDDLESFFILCAGDRAAGS